MKKLVLIAVSLSIGFLLGYSFEASAHGKDPHDADVFNGIG